MQETLDRLGRAGAALRPPATAPGIAATSSALAEAGLPAIPEDYAAFLARHDGLYFDGASLFGTTPIPPPEDAPADTAIPDLLAANRSEADRIDDPALLLIGRTEEDYLVYDSQEMVYLVLDRTDLEDMDEAEDFPALLDLIAAERL